MTNLKTIDYCTKTFRILSKYIVLNFAINLLYAWWLDNVYAKFINCH